MTKVWDVFISHASEDKNSIVRELAELLEKLKVKVWYDEFALTVGDSLSRSIDEGLLKSNFGVVIISKKFLEKNWTDYEYRSLLSKEEKGKKVILPIWHNITQQEVKNFSLYLSDKVALDTSLLSTNKLALKIAEVVRPDIIHSLKSYLLFKDLVKNGTRKEIKVSELKKQPKSLSKLSKNLEVRARNIYYGIGQTLNMSIDESIYNYELDLRPDREIQLWEIMNLCYLEFLFENKITDFKTKQEVSSILIGLSLGQLYEQTKLNENDILKLIDLFKKYQYEY